MSRIIHFLLIAFWVLPISAQQKPQQEPEFYSITLSEDRLQNFNLVCNYYTIEKNISNPQSPVFLTDQPSLAEYIRFARSLPSYYFLVKRKDSVMFSIILNQVWEGAETKFEFTVFDPNTKRRVKLPCKTWGEISELRAAEMHQLKFDTNVKWLDLPTDKLLEFNGVGYKIQPYFELKDEVIQLSNQLYEKAVESRNRLREYIKHETIGGKMDFGIALADEPNNKIFMVNGVGFSKQDYIMYLWSQACANMGLVSAKEARLLWKEIYKVNVNKTEADVIRSGFKEGAKG